MFKTTLRTRELITLTPNLVRPSAINPCVLTTSKSTFAQGRIRPYCHPTSLMSLTTIVTLVVASSILPPLFKSLETLSQRRVCLQFKSESLDHPQFVAALSILPPLIESLETLSQRRVCLQCKSESLDRPQLTLPRVYSLQTKLWKNSKSNFLQQ